MEVFHWTAPSCAPSSVTAFGVNGIPWALMFQTGAPALNLITSACVRYPSLRGYAILSQADHERSVELVFRIAGDSNQRTVALSDLNEQKRVYRGIKSPDRIRPSQQISM
ncbi:hypothetical protein SBC1_53770 (plasmid) [Caballeronia sp. SBC1]|nr:hypothetical protein SBC2_52590 [Caballeronia sp. SBC2]QIN65332.1 hypothetical protein SBC1_53770 [Caballeronia sp. SBC1]